MRKLLVLSFICIITSVHAQKKEIHAFFTQMNGSRWECQGKWKVGKPFHQIYTFEWSENNIVCQVNTFDFERSENKNPSLRNVGIRKFDQKNNQWKFWEFDYLGGITEGKISYREQSIYYTYAYEVNGQTNWMTDAWEFVNDSTYNFKIGVWENESWTSVYCEGVVKRQ